MSSDRRGLRTRRREQRLSVGAGPTATEVGVWTHEVAEGEQPQLAAERVPYEIDVSRWGSGPTNVACELLDVTDDADWTDVSATCLTGAASVAGNVITSPTVSGLTAGRRYRLNAQFEVGARTYVTFALIVCRK